MKRGVMLAAVACLVLLVALSAGDAPSAAQTGGGYDLTWSSIEPGGPSAGGAFSLRGSAGQADAGVLSGGGYALAGGFWSGVAGTELARGYLPLVVK